MALVPSHPKETKKKTINLDIKRGVKSLLLQWFRCPLWLYPFFGELSVERLWWVDVEVRYFWWGIVICDMWFTDLFMQNKNILTESFQIWIQKLKIPKNETSTINFSVRKEWKLMVTRQVYIFVQKFVLWKISSL